MDINKMNGKTEKNIISVRDACCIKNKIYFSNSCFNSLLYFDLIDYKIHFVGQFQSEDNIEQLHCNVFQEDEQLYFIPYKGSYISIYDLETDSLSTILLCNSEKEKINPIKALKINGEIWMFPHNTSSEVIVFDINRRTLKTLEEWNRFRHENDEVFDFRGIVKFHNDIILVPYGRNYFFSWSMRDGLISKVELPKELKFRAVMSYKEKIIFTLSNSDDLILYDFERTERIVCDLKETDEGVEHYTYTMPIAGDLICIMSSQFDEILFVDLKTNTILKDNSINVRWGDKIPPYISCVGQNSGLLYLPYSADSIMIVPEGKTASFYKCEFENDGIGEFLTGLYLDARGQKLLDVLRKNDGIINELDLSIQDLFQGIIKDELFSSRLAGKDNIGEKVWRVCKT